jgi:predicted dehydrogenase
MKNSNQEIHNIIDSRLFKAADSVKKRFPNSISSGSGFYVDFGNEKLHVILFLDRSEKDSLDARLQKRYDPFPGLLTTEEGIGAAFRFENSKNCIIEGFVVNNSYALSLGKNSSIVLVDHNQEIKTDELGVLKYKIDLGFIITFPGDSSPFDLNDAFDDLISYYISTRRDMK